MTDALKMFIRVCRVFLDDNDERLEDVDDDQSIAMLLQE